jgi:Kelch motif protein
MNDIDTIARRHAEEVRKVVAEARLPGLNTHRSQAVRIVPRPVWAILAAATVMLVFGLRLLVAGPKGDDDVVATTVPTSIAGIEAGFVPTGTMTGECSWCTAVLLDDRRVLVLGGTEAGAPIAEIYDPATWTFTPTGRPSNYQVGDAVLLDDGRVLVVGGSVTDTGAVAQFYDPASGAFRSIERSGAEGQAAVRLADGRVLVIGQDLIGVGNGSAVIFDPTSDTFTATSPAIVQRGLYVTATLLDDGRVLVAGGESSGSAEIYDPETDAFTPTGSLVTARDAFTATSLVDGRVLIIGGSAGGSAALASAEIYDPENGAFAPTGSMATPRFWHAAALLSDGRVLVIGGGDGAGDRGEEGTAEIYDPVIGLFTPAPAPTTNRLAATALSLADGNVLVLGHYPGNVGGSRAGSNSAEIFALVPVERPIGCCGQNPNVIELRTRIGSDQNRLRLVIPAGGLEGAIEASYFYQYGSSGSGGVLTLPQECGQGCELQIPALEPGSLATGGEVSVEIAYAGTPPAKASSITLVGDAASR